MKKYCLLLVLVLALSAYFGCTNKSSPAEPEATATPADTFTITQTPTVTETSTITQTHTITPTFTVTNTPRVYIQSAVYNRQSATNDLISAYITSDSTPEPAATVIVINTTQSLTYVLPHSSGGEYNLNSNIAYSMGDVFRLNVHAADRDFTADATAPGDTWVSDYIAGTGVTVTCAVSGSRDYLRLSGTTTLYSQYESDSTQFTYPIQIADSVFLSAGSGSYAVEFVAQNTTDLPDFGGTFSVKEFWYKGVTVP